MTGKTISHYKILEKLGQGGMGIVYKAQDTKLDRFVALKFLPPHLDADDEQKSRFIQEAKAASAIDHPNIASVYEISETDDGHIFIVMAYYEGETLKKKIEGGPLPIERALDIAIQVSQGLAKAHEHGIVHRDLKPHNVLVTTDGIAKIIDFGLAKLMGGTQLTRTGTTLGTVAYMSPEQARGDELDPTTDIWSLGIITYEMLTGQLPFRGEFETAMMYSIVNEEPPQISSLRSDVPMEFESIVEKTLKKDRRQRYQRMGEVVAVLTTLRKNVESGAATDTSKQLATRLIRSVVKKHRTPILVGGSLLMIAIIGLFVLRWNMTQSAASINRSIAVLPFANTGDSSNAYYADGFSQDLISSIAKLPQALLISRIGSAAYKKSALSDSGIAAALGVRFLLKGKLQLSIARLKVSASLFDVEKGKEAWNQSYDGYRSDILTIKEKILKNAAQSLSINYDPTQFTEHKPTAEVYESYLHGLFFRDKLTKGDNRMAREYLKEAVEKDSMYVAALVSLANTDVEHYRQGWDKSEKILKAAEKLSERAAALDSSNGQPMAILGNIADLHGNREKAVSLLSKAVEKEKNNVYALTSLAIIYLMELNEPRKAVVNLEKLQELEPTDWLTASNLGVAYAQIKNYTKAKQAFRRAMELNSIHEFPLVSLGYTCERLGEIDSAIIYYLLAYQKNPKSLHVYENLTSVLLARGSVATAESIAANGMKFLNGDPEIYYFLGVAYSFGGKKSFATRTFQDGLKLVQEQISQNPDVGDYNAYAALFQARLAHIPEALSLAAEAGRLDSTNEDVVLKIARVYAVLGMKDRMLDWYKRAKSMSPEYDVAYLTTAMDFEKFRKDVDLLAIARQE